MSGVVYVGGPPEAFKAPSKLPELPSLTVPVPDGGWLTLVDPVEKVDRMRLYMDWEESAATSIRAAGLVPLRYVAVTAVARLRSLPAIGAPGVHHPEDVRPSLRCVLRALRDAAVLVPEMVVAEELRLGRPTGPAAGEGYLQLWLTEVPGA